MTNVTLPPKLTVIGGNTFLNCDVLGSVDIPATVTAIQLSAFQSNTALTSVTIPAKVNSIGESAFQNCTKLATVNFTAGSQLTAIGKNGFYDCPITSLALPDGLVFIGENSFYHNRLTGSLSIPAKVTAIGTKAFEGDADATPNLATLNIQSTGPLSIGAMAFSNQPLTSITIPASVTINDNAATMGINGTDFKNAYTINGAGPYQFASSVWSKE